MKILFGLALKLSFYRFLIDTYSLFKLINLKKIILIILVMMLSRSFFAQEKNGPHAFVSPRINIGYTFGAGMTYGFDIFVGGYSLDKLNLGLAYSYYFANTQTGVHRLQTISLTADNPMIHARIGAGMVKRVWGLHNVNKAKTQGIAIDVSAGFDEYHAPWVGLKAFIQNRRKWPFFDLPSYISIYSYFKTPEIEIYDQRIEGN